MSAETDQEEMGWEQEEMGWEQEGWELVLGENGTSGP